jgi:hypothetical protein
MQPLIQLIDFGNQGTSFLFDTEKMVLPVFGLISPLGGFAFEERDGFEVVGYLQ